jgi:hypothetical protein
MAGGVGPIAGELIARGGEAFACGVVELTTGGRVGPACGRDRKTDRLGAICGAASRLSIAGAAGEGSGTIATKGEGNLSASVLNEVTLWAGLGRCREKRGRSTDAMA